MPILERDPWRLQYFQAVECPSDLIIPTDDPDCYELYPRHRWIYNKLLIAETQGLAHGPHGVAPPFYPVFSKPVYNLRGMGIGGRILHDEAEYRAASTPGHMWSALLEGEHLSSDVAVVDGEPAWWRHTIGIAQGGGTFDYWHVLAEPRPALEAKCGRWLRHHLRGYTGIVNLETIGGTMIEAHLRFSDQWPDLYGEGWLDALVRLYVEGRWSFADGDRRDGYSVVLFGEHEVQYRHPPEDLLTCVRALAGVESIQITFHADRAPCLHAMPPGGFRLAIVNCTSLQAGREARALLATSFERSGLPLRNAPRAVSAGAFRERVSAP